MAHVFHSVLVAAGSRTPSRVGILHQVRAHHSSRALLLSSSSLSSTRPTCLIFPLPISFHSTSSLPPSLPPSLPRRFPCLAPFSSHFLCRSSLCTTFVVTPTRPNPLPGRTIDALDYFDSISSTEQLQRWKAGEIVDTRPGAIKVSHRPCPSCCGCAQNACCVMLFLFVF